MIGIMYI